MAEAAGGAVGSDRPMASREWWASARYVRRRYRDLFGHSPRLLRPRTQSERILHRKLFERDPRMPQRQDKIAVKAHVARLIGPEYVIPTLWSGDSLPRRRERDWPRPFVLKAAHGCGWNAIVDVEGPVPWRRIERKADRWMATTYGSHSGEWLYSRIPRRLLVEERIGSPGTLPDDYKLWVYRGRVHFIHWVTDRGTSGYGGRVMDRDWREAFEARQVPRSPQPAPRPASLETMIEIAEELAEDWPFVRIDLYDVAGHPLFGEYTFYPTSGYHVPRPAGTDRRLGDLWVADPRPPGGA